MKKIMVLSVLILLLVFLLWWQLAELRTSNSNLSSNPAQAEKTVAREPALEASQGNKPREDGTHDGNKAREDPARDGVDVFGVVRNEAGKPISGAEVKAIQGSDNDRGGDISTATMKDGSYSLRGLRFPSASPYKVVASTAGYAPATSGLFFISHPPKRIDLTLTKGAFLSGHVMDESRRAISGATVELLQGAWNAPMANIGETKTDADGAYAFKHISPDEYWLFVSAGRYINQERNIIIGRNRSRPIQDFFLEFSGEGYLSGVVLDEDDQPLEGVKIKASQTGVGALLTGTLSHKCISSADGSFHLEGFVPRGSGGSKVPIKLNATKEGYKASRITVFSGDQRVLIRLQKDHLGSISGRVVEAGGGDFLTPITEFQVEVLWWRNSIFAFRQFQSATGEFLFPDIDEGHYDLFISAPNRAPHCQENLTVKSGEETSAGVIRLARGATITGKVRGKGKPEPLSGAMVYIKAGRRIGGYFRILTGTTTDETGSYRLEGVPPGPKYVLASYPDYATAISPKIEVVEGKEYSNIDMVLGNGGSIEGKVTDNGIPLAGQMVGMFPMEHSAGALGPFIYIQTNEKGRYRKDKLMPGFYYCSANIPSRRADVTGESNLISDTVEVLEDRTTTFDIGFCEGSGSVTGKVMGEAPIQPEAIGVSVQLYSGQGWDKNKHRENNYFVETSVGSSYSFENVCPGEYNIRTSVVYAIPGGTGSRDIPFRLSPPGSFEVQAGRVTQRDVILITYE